MKEKIRLALVKKYKDLGFSDKAIDAVLAFLETTVTAEDQIDAAVDGVEGILKGFQGEATRWAQTAVANAKKEQVDPNKTGGGDPNKKEEPVGGADTPEWAKGLLTSVKTLSDTVATLQAEKIGGTRKSQVEKALENVSETYRKGKLNDFDRMNFKDDEDFNSYLEGVKTDSADFVQTETNAGLSKAGKPIMATGGVQTKQATDAELDSAMSNFSI